MVTENDGLFAVKYLSRYYSLEFKERGWIAGELVGHVDDLIESGNPQRSIVKLLGFTLQISSQKPRRQSSHWVVVDIENRVVETNSQMVENAIDQSGAPEAAPYSNESLERIFSALDRFDFTVKIYK